MKSIWYKVYIYGKTQNLKKKNVTKDHGGFQQQSSQRLAHRYQHMNRHRNRMILQLKAIEAEYYSSEN